MYKICNSVKKCKILNRQCNCWNWKGSEEKDKYVTFGEENEEFSLMVMKII